MSASAPNLETYWSSNEGEFEMSPFLTDLLKWMRTVNPLVCMIHGWTELSNPKGANAKKLWFYITREYFFTSPEKCHFAFAFRGWSITHTSDGSIYIQSNSPLSKPEDTLNFFPADFMGYMKMFSDTLIAEFPSETRTDHVWPSVLTAKQDPLADDGSKDNAF